jgi:6-pyruvoyltetrahydropterin/6-carboxytetrahydropterin synthase
MIHITRRETFNAAHNLFNPAWSAEKNYEIFGPCSRIHGHNWELFVTVAGEVNPEIGYVMDLKILRDVLREHIISKLDHMYINEDVAFMNGILPSTENVAIGIWNILEPILDRDFGAKLYKIKLTETVNHFVEYYGG